MSNSPMSPSERRLVEAVVSSAFSKFLIRGDHEGAALTGALVVGNRVLQQLRRESQEPLLQELLGDREADEKRIKNEAIAAAVGAMMSMLKTAATHLEEDNPFEVTIASAFLERATEFGRLVPEAVTSAPVQAARMRAHLIAILGAFDRIQGSNEMESLLKATVDFTKALKEAKDSI